MQIFLFYFSFSSYISGFALFAERRFTLNGVPLSPKQVGYAFAYFGLLGILIQGFLIGRLVKRIGERRVVLFGFLSSFLGYGALGFIHAPLWIALSGLFTSFGGGVLRPVLISEIAGAVDPRERGRVIGVTQSLQSVAQIGAPLLGTALIGRSLLMQWALLPALLNGVGFLLVVFQMMRSTENANAAD
jgi:MFS family permease